MRTNLSHRIASLERRVVRLPQPVRLLPGEWPYAAGWAPGESCSRGERMDRIFTPGAASAEYRSLMDEAYRLWPAENDHQDLQAEPTVMPRWSLLAETALLLLWSPEYIAIELARLSRQLDKNPEICAIGLPLVISKTLAAYMATDPIPRMLSAWDARAGYG